MAFKFEKLEVWQKSIKLSSDVHDLTKNFPKEELYILTSQIKRAADSVALNIAEGSTGQSNAEFKQFLGYAIRSSIEVVSWMKQNVLCECCRHSENLCINCGPWSVDHGLTKEGESR
ncbi:MAG: four helix bundle protein [Candidatus Omnitrophota bacterium]